MLSFLLIFLHDAFDDALPQSEFREAYFDACYGDYVEDFLSGIETLSFTLYIPESGDYYWKSKDVEVVWRSCLNE
jgi:hypothetical protein